LAPTNLVNLLKRRDGSAYIKEIEPGWTDPNPVGKVVKFLVTVTPAGLSPTTVTIVGVSYLLINLTPATTYSFSIVAVDAVGRTSSALVGTITTSPTDAINDLTKDLQNVKCTNNTRTAFNRAAIVCTWGQPPSPNPAPVKIHVSCRCHSPLQRNRRIVNLLPGTSTNVTFNVGRSSTTCHVDIRAHYVFPWTLPGRIAFGHIFGIYLTIGP